MVVSIVVYCYGGFIQRRVLSHSVRHQDVHYNVCVYYNSSGACVYVHLCHVLLFLCLTATGHHYAIPAVLQPESYLQSLSTVEACDELSIFWSNRLQFSIQHDIYVSYYKHRWTI